MALSYIRFTELDAVSSVAPDDIAPVVETITNINKKITIGNLNNSLAVTADVSVLKAASGNWQSTYNNVQSNYNNWNSVYSSVQSTSGSWNTASAYATVYATNSGEYESTYTSLVANSAIYDNAARYPGWDSNYNTTNANSARWSSVYSAYNAVSSTGFNPFAGAGIASNGTQGLVPTPQGGEDNANLAGDGTFHLNVWDQAQPPGYYNAQTSYYQPFMMQRTTRDGAIASGTIFFVPFRITQTISVSAIRLYNNQVAAAAGTTAKLAIYKWRTQYGKPRATDLVSSQFGTLDLTQTGGLISYATNPVTLARGLYFVAFAASGATGTMSKYRDDLFHAQLFATVDYANVWPAASFPCTPAKTIATLGTTYAALWPSSLSVNSSSTYDIE
ncbi:MAG: hypothetical protein EBU08_17600, partial [Micrococcales bacterium]|nr:hypothetical protein [Micrococcales bacterium]